MSEKYSNEQKMGNEEDFEILLREKFRRDEIQKLKQEIPMPGQKEFVVKTNYSLKSVLAIAASLLFLVSISTFLFSSYANNSEAFADTLIAESYFATSEDNEERGIDNENFGSSDLTVKFDKAVSLAKGSDDQKKEALELLKTITVTRNKFQIEGKYLEILLYAALGQNQSAKKGIEEIKQLSNYQSNNINKLLELLIE